MKHNGETSKTDLKINQESIQDEFSLGFVLGVLVSDGHFGGDGKQPHITLRMHVRHAGIFAWLLHFVPGSKVYGPYRHDGRNYYQWMARGRSLKDLAARLKLTSFQFLDPFAYSKFRKMLEDYQL